MTLTARDEERLKGVHPDLVRVVRRAATNTPLRFAVLEVPRTVARQKQLVAQGASKTMNSRHIPGADGLAKAVDIAPMLNGKISWDWPLYHRLAAVVKEAAKQENVPIEWGGDWRTFKDGPHWQLPHRTHP